MPPEGQQSRGVAASTDATVGPCPLEPSPLLGDGTAEPPPDVWLFRHDRGLTVIDADGPDVVLGDSSNYDFKAAAWGALLDEIERDELLVAEIDLRFGRNAVLR